jgi:aryl-alcohol dehydrogenase-like predicted oxidoreductase
VSVAQVALAWLLAQPHVTSVIIGAKNQEHLLDNIARHGARAVARSSSGDQRRLGAAQRISRSGC